MRSTFIAILCLFSQVLSAQVWQWSHQIGGPSSEGVYVIGTDAISSVYIYGFYSGGSGLYLGDDTLYGSGGSAYLAKYSFDGTLVWVRNCTSPNGVGINGAVLDTITNKLYVVGAYFNSCLLDTCSLSGLASGGYISQWNLDGHCLWARNAVTSGPDLANHFCNASAVTVDLQGHVYVGGKTTPYGPNYLAGRLVPQGTYLSAYTATGDTIWNRMVAYYQGNTVGFTPVAMQTWNGSVFVYNGIYLDSESDTLLVDTVTISGIHGGGHALSRIDPVDGSLDWLRIDGYPNAGVSGINPQRFVIDGAGRLYVAGFYGTAAIFGTDTLSEPSGGGFLAEYDADGARQWVRGFESTQGVNFTALCVRPDGGLEVTGWVRGSANWDGIALSTTGQNMLVASFTATGLCTGAEGEVGPAIGKSLIQAQDGYYIAGQFPPGSPPTPPYEPITIGSETYNTFGGTDAFIAKHSLATSIASQAMGSDGLHIYANPNRGSFQLEMPDAFANERDLVLRIYDSTGRMVLEQPMDMTGEAVHLDVFDAVPGFYNVTLTNGRRSCSGSMVVE